MSRPTHHRLLPWTVGLCLALSVAACGDDAAGPVGAGGTAAGGTGAIIGAGPGGATGGAGGSVAPTGGTGAPTAGSVAPTGGTGAPTGGTGAPTGGTGAPAGEAGTPESPSAGSGSGGTGGGQAPAVAVDCSPLAAAGYELCSSTEDACGVVFTNAAGCTAVCAAAGLACVSAHENLDGSCGPDLDRAPVACDSGHESDYCECGGSQAGTGGMTGAGAGGAGSGGVENTGGATAGQAPTGGTGGSTGPCQAIGWATRNGRTGGAFDVTGGGDVTPVVVSSFSALQSYAGDGQPRVIHVDGTVGSGWRGTSGDRLEVGSNKTIVGLRPGTELRAAIHVSGSTNVIIRNLVIRGPGSNSDQAWDNINIEGSSKNVWVDHCEFWDGQDGNADVVKGADNVTFTWNIFGYRTSGGHNFSNLVASSDNEPQSVGKLNITLMFNWFTGVAQRQPRCRYGDIHVVNNLFTRDGQASDYGISAGKDCRVLTEANHFIEINTPIYTSHASGSAANQLRGGNIFERTSGNTTGYGTAFEPPYSYDHVLVQASEVKALVEQNVGATLQSPADCDW